MHLKSLYITFFILFGLHTSIAQVSFGLNQSDSLAIENSDKTVKKRAFDKNFKTKYQEKQFQYEYTTKAEAIGWWERFKNWLARKLDRFFSSKQRASNFVSGLIKSIYIIALIIAVYFIVKTWVNQEGNWVFGRNSDKVNINSSEVEQQLMKTDFDTLINKAVKKQDYRLAIRYQYLKTLKTLSKKELIVWDYEKTNKDYYYELKDTNIKSQFAFVSYLYNYSWYGEFDIDENTYQKASLAFGQLFKTINHE